MDFGLWIFLEMKENLVQEKKFDFALKIIGLYKRLIEDGEYVLSKQLLKAGTSIDNPEFKIHNL